MPLLFRCTTGYTSAGQPATTVWSEPFNIFFFKKRGADRACQLGHAFHRVQSVTARWGTVDNSISVHDAVKTNVWPRCTAAHRAAACHNQRIAGSDDVLQSKTQHYLRQSSKVPACSRRRWCARARGRVRRENAARSHRQACRTVEGASSRSSHGEAGGQRQHG